MSCASILKSQIAFRGCICPSEGLYHTDVDTKMENVLGRVLNMQIEAIGKMLLDCMWFSEQMEMQLPICCLPHLKHTVVSIILPAATAEELSCSSAHSTAYCKWNTVSKYCVMQMQLDACDCLGCCSYWFPLFGLLVNLTGKNVSFETHDSEMCRSCSVVLVQAYSPARSKVFVPEFMTKSDI